MHFVPARTLLAAWQRVLSRAALHLSGKQHHDTCAERFDMSLPAVRNGVPAGSNRWR